MSDIVLAVTGGFISASGANVLAWSECHAQKTGKELSNAQKKGFLAASVGLNLVGIAMFSVACAFGGSVSVVMPIQTAANLLANMFWQVTLEVKYFTKNMRVGTLVLACAVAELVEIGPKSPENVDVAVLLTQPLAMCWILILISGTVMSVCAATKYLSQPKDSLPKLILICLVVSLATVIGSNVSKCFLLVSGNAAIALYCFYFFIGITCMYFMVLGTKETEVALFIPCQLALQLVINMFTGYFVWDDASYIDNPLSYNMVYIICILGVYNLSPELDVVRSRLMRNVSGNLLNLRIGTAFLQLYGLWADVRCAPRGDYQELRPLACKSSISSALSVCSEIGVLSDTELRKLVLRLLDTNSSFGPNEHLADWLEEDVRFFKKYIQTNAAFAATRMQTACASPASGESYGLELVSNVLSD